MKKRRIYTPEMERQDYLEALADLYRLLGKMHPDEMDTRLLCRSLLRLMLTDLIGEGPGETVH